MCADAAAICWSLSGIAAGRGVAFDAAFGAVADASSTFASGEGRALANLASAVVDMYGDDSGGLADNGLDVRRILDAVAALAVPLAEGAALEPRSLAALAAAFAACRAAAPAPRLMAALAVAARDTAADFQAKDLVAAADAFARSGVATPVVAAAVRALGADAAGRAQAFPPRLRADLCRALAAVGATDSPFFDSSAAPRGDRLLPPPRARRTRPTRRGSRSSPVVPYSSLFPRRRGGVMRCCLLELGRLATRPTRGLRDRTPAPAPARHALTRRATTTSRTSILFARRRVGRLAGSAAAPWSANLAASDERPIAGSVGLRLVSFEENAGPLGASRDALVVLPDSILIIDLEREQVIISDRRRVATRQRRRPDFTDRPPDVHEREAPAGRVDVGVERRLVQSVVRLRCLGELCEAARRGDRCVVSVDESGGRLDVAAALELAARGLALLAAHVVVERAHGRARALLGHQGLAHAVIPSGDRSVVVEVKIRIDRGLDESKAVSFQRPRSPSTVVYAYRL